MRRNSWIRRSCGFQNLQIDRIYCNVFLKFLHQLIMLQTNNKHVAQIFMEWWISSYKNPFDKKCIPLFTGIILINKKETKKKHFKRIWKKRCRKLARDCLHQNNILMKIFVVYWNVLWSLYIKYYEYLKIL